MGYKFNIFTGNFDIVEAGTPTSRILTANSPITGGGDLSADRSFGFDFNTNNIWTGTNRFNNFVHIDNTSQGFQPSDYPLKLTGSIDFTQRNCQLLFQSNETATANQFTGLGGRHYDSSQAPLAIFGAIGTIGQNLIFFGGAPGYTTVQEIYFSTEPGTTAGFGSPVVGQHTYSRSPTVGAFLLENGMKLTWSVSVFLGAPRQVEIWFDGTDFHLNGQGDCLFENFDGYYFDNDVYIADGQFLVLDKASGNGIKVDATTPTFGWRDLLGPIVVRGSGGTDPNWTTYKGGIKAYSLNVNDEVWVTYHLPHDYVEGTDIFIHPHWSHNSTLVTGGSVTWSFEMTYAKGHNQAAFGTNVTQTQVSNASTIQYQHIIDDTQISVSGGSGTQLDSDLFEPDGLILIRFYLSANNITSSGAVPDPFLHLADGHYQSTNIATKDRAPDFYS